MSLARGFLYIGTVLAIGIEYQLLLTYTVVIN